MVLSDYGPPSRQRGPVGKDGHWALPGSLCARCENRPRNWNLGRQRGIVTILGRVMGVEAYSMIEPIMYVGLGFLAASLLALATIPLVHARAVRLTMRRLEAATPLSIAEIQAHKDQLRADFAMSTRRLEISLEEFKTKAASRLAELGKKINTIHHLNIELAGKTTAIIALETRNHALSDQLHATEHELLTKTRTFSREEERLSPMEDISIAPVLLDTGAKW